MAIEVSSDDEASDSYSDSDFKISIVDVIQAVQELPNMEDDLILDACDFLDNKKNAQIFMALSVKLRRKWLIRKLPRQTRISVNTVDRNGMVVMVNRMEVLTSEKIGEVKAKLGAKIGISPENQRLMYAGKELFDDRSLADYNVLRLTSMTVVDKLRDTTKK